MFRGAADQRTIFFNTLKHKAMSENTKQSIIITLGILFALFADYLFNF